MTASPRPRFKQQRPIGCGAEASASRAMFARRRASSRSFSIASSASFATTTSAGAAGAAGGAGSAFFFFGFSLVCQLEACVVQLSYDTGNDT